MGFGRENYACANENMPIFLLPNSMVNIDKKFVCVNQKIAIEFVTKELAMEINTENFPNNQFIMIFEVYLTQ